MTIFGLALIPAASAFGAVLTSPSSTSVVLHPGDKITIDVTSLASGDPFTYQLSSSNLYIPGNSVTLASTSMPFSFKDGLSTETASATGISAANYTITKDGGAQMTKSGTSFSSSYNIKSGTYVVSVVGTHSSGPVGINYVVSGTVDSGAPSPSTLTFTVPSDIYTGDLTVAILSGSTTKYSGTFSIAPKPVEPTGGGGGGGGAPPAPAPAPAKAASVPAALLAPPGISPTTATLQSNPQGQVLASYQIETNPDAGFSSAVSIATGTTVVSATGAPVTEISVTPVDPSKESTALASAGSVFSFSGLSVECEPSGTQFSGGAATVSFSLTPAQWAEALGKANGNTNAMTIQFFDQATKTWSAVPTVVDPVTHTVTAQVSHFSLYGLFYNIAAANTTPTPQTFGDITKTNITAGTTSASAAGTPAAGTTPVKTMMAPPAPTQSPGLPGIAVIGIVGLVGYFVARKMK
ncbi:hypothetical protein [uncultured Methanoregula sp.]|uniref:hypothetical protein n=1 Tax=uncultured Methanoregula sp. TaxID=1005933 RepID=UPI002AAC1C1F|nr:hypothetical protein [uncultured Methanoregula sp.]